MASSCSNCTVAFLVRFLPWPAVAAAAAGGVPWHGVGPLDAQLVNLILPPWRAGATGAETPAFL